MTAWLPSWLPTSTCAAASLAAHLSGDKLTCWIIGTLGCWFLLRPIITSYWRSTAQWESSYPPPIRERDDSLEALAELPSEDSTRFEGRN